MSGGIDVIFPLPHQGPGYPLGYEMGAVGQFFLFVKPPIAPPDPRPFKARVIEEERRLAMEAIQAGAEDPASEAPIEERRFIFERAKEELERLTDVGKIKQFYDQTIQVFQELSHISKLAKLFGNKMDNLERLNLILKEEIDVTVPTFRGISHEQILTHVRAHFGDFDKHWEGFKRHLAAGGTIESSADLKAIRAGIEAAFDGTHPFLTKAQLKPFKAGRMMVRSTGREDSLKVANPGGNTSVVNVTPERVAVEKAIGEVVISYFSNKSLGQRRAVGDDITAPPFMPVLLQTMAGERPNARAPVVSGVMYTTEGALQTRGVSQINATYGHAEAVVTGSRECDSFYVQGENVHALVQRKKSRLFPDPVTGKLVSRENPRELQERPSLTRKQVLRLDAIGRKLEAAYGYPVDVEWTYDPNDDKFYIFQARPIPPVAHRAESYVTPEKIKELEQVTAVSVIVPGGGEVVELNDKNCIVAVSAPEALQIYLANPNAAPKAILIAAPSASNSHEAGFFREKGIPLIYLPTALDLRHTLAARTLLLDTQEGFIATLPEGKQTAEFVTPGLRYHLAPKMESAMGDGVNLHDFEPFLAELTATAQGYQGPKEAGKVGLRAELNRLEQAQYKESRAIALIRILTNAKRALSTAPEVDRQEIWLQVLRNTVHVWEVLNDPASDELGRKFALNWLRAVLVKRPTETVVNGSSLCAELDQIKERQRLGLLAQNNPYLDLFERSSKFIFSPDWRAEWIHFVNHLKPYQLRILVNFFKMMGPHMIEVWLNKNFHSVHQQGDRAVFQNIIGIMEDPANQENIQFVQRARAMAEQFQMMSGDFGNPEQFERALARLNQEFSPVAKECILRMQMAKGKGMVATLLAQIFKDLVATYDDCIKKFTGSHYDDVAIKAKRFGDILEGYHALTQLMLTQKMLSQDSELAAQAIVLAPFLGGRFGELKKEAARNPEQMVLPSRGFSVSMAALGSGSRAPWRAPANTLEDFFTQLHQSLLTATASVEMVDGFKVEELPRALQDLSRHLLDSLDLRREVGKKDPPTIQSIEYHYPTLRVHFNCPLAHHSAQFVVEAHLDSNGQIKEMEFEGRFCVTLGAGGCIRDKEIGLRVLKSFYPPYNIRSASQNLKIEDTGFVTFGWVVPMANKAFDEFKQSAQVVLQAMIDYLQKDMIDYLQMPVVGVQLSPLEFTKEMIWQNLWLLECEEIDKSFETEKGQRIFKILIEYLKKEYSNEIATLIISKFKFLKKEGEEDLDQKLMSMLLGTFMRNSLEKGYIYFDNEIQFLTRCEELNLISEEKFSKIMSFMEHTLNDVYDSFKGFFENCHQVCRSKLWAKIINALSQTFIKKDIGVGCAKKYIKTILNLLSIMENLEGIDQRIFAALLEKAKGSDVYAELLQWDVRLKALPK